MRKWEKRKGELIEVGRGEKRRWEDERVRRWEAKNGARLRVHEAW
jgi:hypothetical protein